MVNGAQAEWKANADYYAKLDFDSFYRLHKVNMFTIENLGRLVDFYSINVVFTLFYHNRSSKNAEIKFVIADNFHQERELDISFQSKTETDMEL